MDNLNNIDNNIDPIDRNIEDQVLSSYMDFISTSTTSIHSMIEIINNQQRSFNQILSRHLPATRERRTRPSTSYSTLPNSSELNNYNSTPNPIRQYFYRTVPLPYFTTPLNNTIPIFSNISGQLTIPSQEQIDAATEVVLFGNINNPINFSCPISHTDFSANDTVIILKECRHIFSQASILRWFERNVHCPLCRQDIRINGQTENQGLENQGLSDIPEINSPYSSPIPFAQQLANIISNQITTDRDFSGNISIELSVPGTTEREETT